MPLSIRCPECERRLRVPDSLLGKPVKCPNCQKTFKAAAEEEGEPAPAPPPEGEGRRRPPPEGSFAERPSRPDGRRPAEDEEQDDEEGHEEEEESEERPRRRRRRRGRRSAEARSAVMGPAIALMVVGGLAVVVYALNLVMTLAGVGMAAGAAGPGAPADNAEVVGRMLGGVLGTIFGMCWWGIVIAGAFKMQQLQGHGYAMAACIMAMIPCSPCCLLGLPFGIWGLVALNREEVKRAFS